MSVRDVIPGEMWVFVPMATNTQLDEYKIWCENNLGYLPYMNSNLVIFRHEADTVLFKLSYPELI